MNDVRSKHPKGVSLNKKHVPKQPEDDNDEEDDEEGEVISGSDDSALVEDE